MRRLTLLFVLGGIALCGTSCEREPSAQTRTSDPFTLTPGLALVTVAGDADHPVHLTAPAGDARLFVVEQPGRVRILENGRWRPAPFLDLRDRVSYGGERGLLSLAFHPRYAQNGFFFVNYTDQNGDTRIERYRVSRDPNRADPASGVLVLHVEQPYPNHNGGHVLFGPDGMFYIAMGDGGSGGDPHRHGQNPQTLLAKLLRVDVDRARPYAIPRDNPFSRGGGRAEIWALGLRNPWRIAFDPPSGLLYIADVGQNEWEEVHVAQADRPGVNYGWSWFEGRHRYRTGGTPPPGLVMPPVEYDHREGCSITGGVVYRGSDVPALVGHYVFSDYCTGFVRSFRISGGQVVDRREWSGLDAGAVTSFGVDGRGELYVLAAPHRVARVVRRPGG